MTFKKTALFLITSMFVGSTWAQINSGVKPETNANANPPTTIPPAAPTEIPPILNPSVNDSYKVEGSTINEEKLKELQKVESCNAKADAKDKEGGEREQYMKTCLSNE